jgi:hypothetical protein
MPATMGGGPEIVANIGGRQVPRQEVLGWEHERAAKVCARLGLDSPPDDVAARREALVARKLEIGHAALERMLARELRLSARSSRLMTALSRGRRLCEIELTGTGLTAEAMPAFYKEAMRRGDEAPLLAAAPDHYLLFQDADGVQQVIETTGGAPLASRIFLDEGDTASVTTSADPSFPVQWVAVGRAAAGAPPSGAIRHQFRDDGDGFTARLTIELPVLTPGRIARTHRWHLACEFSNWIEAANRVGGH